jgi:hypothetical protein
LRPPAFRRGVLPFIVWAALRAAVRAIFLAFPTRRLAILRAACLPRAAVSLRLGFRRRDLDAFGSIRRAPRTARRAAPVAVSATPAAMSVAVDAAPLAAPLIVSPVLRMMPFFAMGLAPVEILNLSRQQVGRFQLVPEASAVVHGPTGRTLPDRSNPALRGG